MGKKTPPFKNWSDWTTSRFWSFVRSSLRAAWNKYPPKYKVLEDACIGRSRSRTTGRLAKHYLCNKCNQIFTAKEVQVDHLVDAGSLKDYSDLPGFVERLFCSVDDLQVLCKDCHKNKTHDKA